MGTDEHYGNYENYENYESDGNNEKYGRGDDVIVIGIGIGKNKGGK